MKSRRRWLKRSLLVLGVLVAVIAGYALYLLSIAGQFKRIAPHFAGTCKLVSTLPGTEDIVILPDGQGALISSDDRRAMLAGKPTLGAIYYVDLKTPGAQPVNVTPEPPPGFHPHGISLYPRQGAPTTLYVVSHPGADLLGDRPEGKGPKHTIEVFDVAPIAAGTKLTHRRTIADAQRLISPNDVVAVGRDRFYVTNDHGTRTAFWRRVEDYLRLRRSHIIYFDGQGFKRLAGDYRYANGIQASRDGRTIYLASPTDRSIFLFDRDVTSGALTQRRQIFVGTGPDNIEVDSEGNLWIGAHPKLLTFVAHAQDARKKSPSQVLRLTPDGAGGFHSQEIFLSDGSDLSASSVAARHGSRLLVGAVFGPGFLDCTMRDP